MSWVACSALTGEVIADLPALNVGTIEQVLMGYATASAVLPLTDDTNPEWELATTPGGAYLVLLEDDVPTWGGLIGTQTRGTTDSVALTLGTVESYLRRRFVGDVTYTSVDQCSIVQSLVTAYGQTLGLPFQFAVTASAFTRDREYKDINDKTLYSVMTELSGVENGPEWTVGWASVVTSGRSRYVPVLKVSDRLGSGPMAGLDPDATWSLPGDATDVSYVVDFSDGSGANDVMAVSTATNDIRPQSAHAVIVGDSRPKVEVRPTPSTSITNTATLDAHAARILAQVGYGTRTLEMTLKPGSTSRPGIDFQLGDVRGFEVGGVAHPMRAYPGGLKGRGRVVGWKRTLGGSPTVTPMLAELEID